MNIPKAIEILEQDYKDYSSPHVSDLSLAQRLGIEALKRHQDRNRVHFSGEYLPLPGETKD